MRKISQAVIPPLLARPEPAATTTPATPAATPAAPAAVAPAAAPAAPAAPAGQLPPGLLAGGGLSDGFIPSSTPEAPDAKLFFKDNKISENALHGPFDVNGKKLYYPVKFNKNSQKFEYLQLARAVEAPAQ